MDRSTGEPGPSRVRSIFSDASVYPTANLRSQWTEEEISHFADKYDIPYGAWHVYGPTKRDRIYNTPPVPEGFGGVAAGISEATLKCVFRVPMLPLLKKLFEDMGIALGQMDPNGFLHINAFQHRCLAARVEPQSSLFRYQYDFRQNPKGNRFYTIARRSGRPDWVQTNSNNKGSHDWWFFISGPKIAKLSEWRVVDPTKVVMPSILSADSADHRLLCEAEVDRIPLTTSRDNVWIRALWGNGNISIPPLLLNFASMHGFDS